MSEQLSTIQVQVSKKNHEELVTLLGNRRGALQQLLRNDIADHLARLRRMAVPKLVYEVPPTNQQTDVNTTNQNL